MQELKEEQVEMSDALEIQSLESRDAKERYGKAEIEHANSDQVCTGVGFLVFQHSKIQACCTPPPSI